MEPWLEADAVMSACGRYRYALRRSWRQGRGELLVVGLNPSSAEAVYRENVVRANNAGEVSGGSKYCAGPGVVSSYCP